MTLPTLEAFIGCRSLVSRSQTAILFQLRLHRRRLWRQSWNEMAVWIRETSLPSQPLSQTNARLAGHYLYDRCRHHLQNKMAALEVAVHLVKNRLRYYFAFYPTNESCSQRRARSLIKILLASYSSKCY